MADLNDTNKLGTYHISNNLQDYESARSNFFALIIDDFDDLLYPEFSVNPDGNEASEFVTSTSRGKRGAQEVIKLSVNSFFVPHFTSGVIDIRRGNSNVKFADVPTWNDGTLVCQDFVGLETKNVLMAWQHQVYDVVSDTQGRAGDWYDDPVTKTGFHRGYKRNCTLIEYTPDFHQVRYWEIIGCWISRISEGNFAVDESTGGGRTLECQFEYDRAIMHQPDGKWGAVES